VLFLFLRFFLPSFIFSKKIQNDRTIAGRLKVATLGKTNNIQSAFFYYESIRSQELINDSLFQSTLKDAAALFIYPSQFRIVAQKEYREPLQKIARKIPVVVIGAERLHSDPFCQEILPGSELHETIQAFFCFSNGDDCFFRTTESTYQDQKELYQAIRLMHTMDCYADWEKSFYEY
jgi:hypothetical protein